MYESQIEAVLFVSGNPVHFDRLCEIFSLPPDEMLCELESLEKMKEDKKSGLSLIKLDGAYQLCTKQETSEFVKRFLEMKKSPPLSKAALEVLAITAYHQPVTRSFIEQVRGIDSSSIVAGLEEKGLLVECGHLDAPGRPALFTTTEAFLRSFGLESLDALPELPDEYSLDNGQMSLDLDEKGENVHTQNTVIDTTKSQENAGEIHDNVNQVKISEENINDTHSRKISIEEKTTITEDTSDSSSDNV